MSVFPLVAGTNSPTERIKGMKVDSIALAASFLATSALALCDGIFYLILSLQGR
ncbi:MAG: hypothetical protein ACFFGZ_09305 [Candidatus Thorarchaeota archaeon]